MTMNQLIDQLIALREADPDNGKRIVVINDDDHFITGFECGLWHLHIITGRTRDASPGTTVSSTDGNPEPGTQ